MSKLSRAILTALLVASCIVAPGAIAYALWSASATGNVSVSVAAPSAAAPSGLICGDATTVTVGANTRTTAYRPGWNAVPSANAYVVYRVESPYSATPSAYATLSPAPATPSATVSESTLQNNKAYRFHVSTRQGASESGHSNYIWIRNSSNSLSCSTTSPAP